MKLISISVENFGKLHQYRLDPSAGLNTVLAENGWGKTTLAAFLKAMLYGLPKSSKRNPNENERVKYAPWQGGAYGGNLTFSCRAGTFRIERFFDPDSFTLYDVSTGKPSDAFSERVGDELFGIDADGFERSVFLSSRALPTSGKNDTVSAKLTGVLDDAHDMSRFDRAVKMLDDRRKEYKKTGNRGKLGELEEALRSIRDSIRDAEAASASRDAVEADLARLRQSIEKAEHAERSLRSAMDRTQDRRQELRALEEEDAALLSRSGGSLPDEESLSRERALLARLQDRRAELRRVELSAQDRAELDRLAALFPSGAPDAALLSAKQRECDELGVLRGRIAALGESASDARVSPAFRRYGLPDGAVLRAMDASLAAAEKQKSPLRRVRRLSVAGFSVLAVGILLAAAGIFLRSPAIWVPGGILTLLGLILASVGLIQKKRVASSLADQDSKQASILHLLDRYSIPHADGNLRRALERLNFEAGAARSALEQESAVARERSRLEAERARMATDLGTFLSGYGIADGNFADGLSRLERQRSDYLRLLGRRREAEEETSAIRMEIQRLQEESDAFLARYRVAPGPDSALRFRELEQRVARHRSLLERVSGVKSALSALQASPAAESVSEHPGDSPDQRLALLTAELKDLRAKREQAVVLLNDLNRRADLLPEWKEKESRLSDEQRAAERDLLVLQKAQEFLFAAKDALTSRYLGGMRTGFARYLALLAGDAAPEADMNADLDVVLQDLGKTRHFENYSSGWQDLLRFCARLALVDALFPEGETPFLILDDPFSSLDDEHLAAAKDLLRSIASQKQLFYFTCSSPRT